MADSNHKRQERTERAKLFTLTRAFIEVIGNSAKTGQEFNANTIRDELAKGKYQPAVEGSFLRKQLGPAFKQWVAAKKIRRLTTYAISKHNGSPIPNYAFDKENCGR